MHLVTLRPHSRRYGAIFRGAVLVRGSRDPEFASCRALIGRGITGTVEFWWEGASAPAMRMDIEWGAKWMAVESDAGRPIIRTWTPPPSLQLEPISPFAEIAG
jgi:hypothetical protein